MMYLHLIIKENNRGKILKKFCGAEKFTAAITADDLDLFLFLVKNIYLVVQHVLVL